MHLAINATEIGRQRGGNESYLLGLLQGLSQVENPSQVTLLMTAKGIAEYPEIQSSRVRCFSIGRYRRLYYHFWQQTAVLHQLRPDWYLSTFFLPPVARCRTAVLVHDMSFRTHPAYFPVPVALYMRFLSASAIRKADRVIALSHFTRQEILRYHPGADRKTSVVYPGVNDGFTIKRDGDDVARLHRLEIEPGYILSLGNIHPRKNLSRLLEAYVLLKKQRGAAPALVWAGVPRWDSDDLLERAQNAGVVILGHIPQDDLPALYRQAIMLAYPSLYEGFGLPPVEAMACGTPVVVSNTTGLPEAVGKAGLLVDPTNVVAIANAMARLLDDADLRESLRAAGLVHAAQFTWERAARGVISQMECMNRSQSELTLTHDKLRGTLRHPR